MQKAEYCKFLQKHQVNKSDHKTPLVPDSSGFTSLAKNKPYNGSSGFYTNFFKHSHIIFQ